jgi:hypothetical protein
MRRFLFALAGLVILTAESSAQAPVAPERGQPYAITPDVGAWTICAASFTGEHAAKRAGDLVTELRTQYRVSAYLFNRGDELRRQEDREVAERRRQKEEYLRKQGIDPTAIPIRIPRARIEDQYAVLVGGYRDMEAARKELERIKKLPPPKSVPADTVVQTGAAEATGKPTKEQKTTVNPFGSSFVARNPSVPVTREDRTKVDAFLKQLNSDESYSLLKCKQPVTLMVKEFHGAMVFQPQDASSSFMDKLFGSKAGGQLSAAADNAHNLAQALEKAGFKEVYILHTRTSSIVSIGGFRSAEDPNLHQVRQLLISRFRVATNDSRVGPQMSLIDNPVPIPVRRV